MTRMVKGWKPISVDEVQVAPHLYRWDDEGNATGLEDSMAAWRAKIPYKVGDVIFIDRNGEAKKALVYLVLSTRDRFGFRRELYRCQVETAAGVFSKMWINVWPGDVQRGYLKAGRAPDLEGKL